MRRQLDDTLPLDEADEFDGDHASTADTNVANPPVVVNEDEDRSTHDDALMAEANIGDLADDADNGEFDHALSENADRSNVTIADTEVDHGGMAEAHDQREAVFEGDSRVQAVTVNAPARNDDDAEMGGLINGNQKDDAVLGEEVEFDVDVDIGANSDWDSDDMSVNSTSVASVEHLKTVSTNAHTVPTNANPEDDDSGFEMGDTIMRVITRPPDAYLFDLIVSIELSYFAVRSDVPGDGNCGYYSIMNVLIRHFRRVCPDHPSLSDELSGVSFAKATWFRQMIHEYVSREAESLLDPTDPVFIDEYGKPLSDFKLSSRERDGAGRMTTHDGRTVPTFYYMLDKIYNA